MRRLLAGITAVMVLSNVVAACGGSSGGSGGDNPVIVPGRGQAFVTGHVDRLTAEDAQAPSPLTTPLTLTASERGAGNASIENALIDGKRSTISWGSGTPLPISGAGGLDLGPVRVDVDAGGVTWNLDGAPRAFVAGVYHVGAPVAVGSAGIATPRDAVDFRADDQTVLISHGGVVVHFDARQLDLQGPGKISVSGRLRVQTASGTRSAGTVTFGPGPFKVTLSPATGGFTVDSVLQGAFTAA